MKMASSGAIAAIAVVAVILTAFGSYYYTATPLNAQVSSYQTSVSSYQSVVSSMSAHPSTTTIYSTTTQTTTSISITTTTSITTQTETSISVSTSTEIVYPIPDNVTVSIVPSGEFTNYAINAGSYSSSGSTGGQKSFSISPVYQNETITISIVLSCPGSTGPSASAFLYINSAVVSQTSVACGGNTNGQISYVL